MLNLGDNMPNIKKYKTKRQLKNRAILSEICAYVAFAAICLLVILGF